MRHSFTLQLEYGGALRGSEKHQLKEEIEKLAVQKGIYSFSYEDDTSERFAFFAVPSTVDLHKDFYELSTFKLQLEKWLGNHVDIECFDCSQLSGLSEITRKPNVRVNSETSNSRYLRLRS